MLKILQARLQQDMNRELPDVQAGFSKGRGIRDQIANIRCIIEKAREFQKNIYFCFIYYTKDFVWVTTTWKIRDGNTRPSDLPPEKSVCMSRTVRTGHGTTDCFQIGQGLCQGCILSPCLFNFYAEYIMRNTGLDEAQAGIKIVGININNLRYVDDSTLIPESKENLNSLLMKVKEKSEKVGLK